MLSKLAKRIPRALDLEFRSNTAFDPRITYSGASVRWRFDSTGKLRAAPHNLGRDSENIQAATWLAASNLTLGGATTTPPSPYSSAKSAIETSATGLHSQDTPDFTFLTGATYTAAFVFSSIGGRNAEIGFPVTLFTARFAKFTLSGNGAVYSTDAGVTASIEHLGGGFYLCKATSTCVSGASARVTYFVNNDAYSRSYAGDITKGLYVTGFSLTLGSDQTLPYVPTTTAAVYLPRANAYQDHDPSTLEPRGFLREKARTNLLLSSQDFRSSAAGNPISAWGNSNVTVTADAIASPTGDVNADLLTINVAGNAMSQATQAFSAGSTITVSIFAKAATSNFIRIELGNLVNCWYNLSTGATATNGAGSGNVLFSSKKIQNCGNGWYRCILTVTTTTITSLNVVVFATNTDNNTSSVGSSVYVFGAMAEVGPSETSYIASFAAAAVRLADSAAMTGTNFSGWYNQSEGTFYAEKALGFVANGTNQFTARASDNSYNNSVALNTQSGGFASLATASGGVFDGTATSSTIQVANVFNKTAASYRANDLALNYNGAAAVTDNSATIPAALTRLDIGADHAGANDCDQMWIKRLTYYRTWLPNPVRQALTT